MAMVMLLTRSMKGGKLIDRVDDNDQSSPPQELLSIEQVAPGMRPKKRTKNFSQQEDEMLVLAWLNTSMDTAVDQPRSSYWTRIYDYFHGNRKFNSERNQNSLGQRWGVIQDHVSKFTECLSCIEDTAAESELSSEDKVSLYVLSSLITSYGD
jgi:hypothetical protein